MRVSNNKDVDVNNVAHTKKGNKASSAAANTDAAGAGGSASIGDSASVNISGEAKAIAQATKIARSDDVDQAKIDKIKASINSGTYKPDYGKVADRMVNEQLAQELA